MSHFIDVDLVCAELKQNTHDTYRQFNNCSLNHEDMLHIVNACCKNNITELDLSNNNPQNIADFAKILRGFSKALQLSIDTESGIDLLEIQKFNVSLEKEERIANLSDKDINDLEFEEIKFTFANKSSLIV